ncbi:hypothetical protein X802_10270 [Thermococcus guaymasensis DSM 11113]|uniref:Uncharacterized protein n=1 Tax=Thermococcus guaymasensis DSM 11113 TaxID=1432656 RepID=A0A0X1KNN9_9EURY|nr:hypothetical protein [Thermococcus guaymasensis]AJC72830.1 hypothetical protein X802_10270 [Thermococcus guaymasensis DSM 11113]
MCAIVEDWERTAKVLLDNAREDQFTFILSLALSARTGRARGITELPDVSAFRKTVSGEVELYYLIENPKEINSPWGSVSVGRAEK